VTKNQKGDRIRSYLDEGFEKIGKSGNIGRDRGAKAQKKKMS